MNTDLENYSGEEPCADAGDVTGEGPGLAETVDSLATGVEEIADAVNRSHEREMEVLKAVVDGVNAAGAQLQWLVDQVTALQKLAEGMQKSGPPFSLGNLFKFGTETR